MQNPGKGGSEEGRVAVPQGGNRGRGSVLDWAGLNVLEREPQFHVPTRSLGCCRYTAMPVLPPSPALLDRCELTKSLGAQSGS